MNDIRQDMQRKPAELEQEADRARARVEHTIEALEQKFSPGQLLDQALQLVKSNGSGFGHNLTTQIRNNPMPLVLTGIGLTWLISASDRPPQYTGSTSGSSGGGMSSAASGARSAAGGVASRTRAAADSVSGAAHGARQAMGNATDSTRTALGNMAGATRQRAAGWADASRNSARSVADGYDYLRREQPLVLGAIAVAAGAALGALLPSTRREDEWMGEQSEEATRRLKREGREKAAEAKSAAADAAEAAREAADPNRQGTRAGEGF